MHEVVSRVWPEGVAGSSAGSTRFDALAEGWAIIPADPQTWNRVMYVVLVAGVLALTVVRGWWRIILAAPVLYLAVSIWESAMLPQPAVARYLLIGAMLRRPDGGAPAGTPRRPPRRGRVMAEQTKAPLLELRGVSMAFGGLRVIDDLDLRVEEDEIVSVIGPNGAGKTTLFNLVTGVYEPTAGEILFEERSLVGLAPHNITRRGIARTFQTLRLFLNMTVLENVMAAAYGHTTRGGRPLDVAHAGDASRGT